MLLIQNTKTPTSAIFRDIPIFSSQSPINQTNQHSHFRGSVTFQQGCSIF